VVLDPTNHLHLLINFHQNCSGGHTPVCFGESTDGGTTWKLLDFPASLSSGWGEGSGLMILKPDVWLYEQWHLFYTADHGATWANLTSSGITPCFNGNTSTPPQTPDGTYYLGASPGIWKSTDGATWSAIPNSGVGNVCAVIGDGARLYTGTIQNPQTISFATYADPTHWSTLATPGLPAQPPENLYTFAVDPAHHILYSTIQLAGFWRVVTQ
jgi:hypothetical protein